MSRQPAFPTNPRRPRSPAESAVPSAAGLPSTTRPLQIGRSTPRSTTSSNASTAISNDFTPGPLRPQRSEHRARGGSEFSTSDRERIPNPSRADGTSVRDSASTTRSDASLPYRTRRPSVGASSMPQPRPRGDAPRAPDSISSPISPSSNAAVLAFQNAVRKRTVDKTTEELEYDQERAREREQEQRIQQRIKDKAPGRRPNGAARTGNIDGTSVCNFFNLFLMSIIAVLDQIRDEWDFVISDNVS